MSAKPLDTEIQQMLAAMAQGAPSPHASLQEVREAQSAAVAQMPPGPQIFRVVDVDLGGGERRLPGRLYYGSAKPKAMIIFYHGGGWISGGVATSDAPMRRVTAGTGALVLSVDYRLAPEHPFPAAFEDAHQAVRWAANNSDELTGHAGTKIVVSGESAGANLAAAVALAARSEGPIIDGQILSCPVLSSDLSTNFFRESASPFPPKGTLPGLFQIYAPRLEDRTDYRFAPLLAGDLANLPPALVFTVELDAFREQGELYATRLHEAQVPCELTRFEGTIHGFLELDGGHRQSIKAIDLIAEFLSKKCGESSA